MTPGIAHPSLIERKLGPAELANHTPGITKLPLNECKIGPEELANHTPRASAQRGNGRRGTVTERHSTSDSRRKGTAVAGRTAHRRLGVLPCPPGQTDVATQCEQCKSELPQLVASSVNHYSGQRTHVATQGKQMFPHRANQASPNLSMCLFLG